MSQSRQHVTIPKIHNPGGVNSSRNQESVGRTLHDAGVFKNTVWMKPIGRKIWTTLQPLYGYIETI